MSETLTKAQRAAIRFAADASDDIPLWQYRSSGHSLQTLMSLCNRDLMSWHSNTHMVTCTMPSEYEHIRDTTSFVAVTDAGRAALEKTP